ncbi:MAG: DNA polymerase IV, partial [Actinobacteria bacterium]|nr:DNA polymerase IV [Actinomycetota bacterium]NIS37124.1 DNA polymerase IV [Actinomycetota bacterium]NIU22709.1 DNA polymerase IV [Actinomycetota bacterium]NIU71576.1 DNA polymerase IV [Actinomycetota bacterium]NIV90915.1 DNA polymerase IV [Actinomycetota bacterium]
MDRHQRARSVGSQSAFGGARDHPDHRRETLTRLSDRVGSRLRKKGRAGRTVAVRIRFEDMEAITRAATLAAPVSSTSAIFQVAEHLTSAAIAEVGGGRRVNLLGVRVSGLTVDPHIQLELPLGDDPADAIRAGSPAAVAGDRLDGAIDALRRRFG